MGSLNKVNPEIEYSVVKDAKKNLMVNLVNPVIILTELSKKIIKNNSSFMAVFCSLAGLRGRKKQLYYSSSKAGLITFHVRLKTNQSFTQYYSHLVVKNNICQPDLLEKEIGILQVF